MVHPTLGMLCKIKHPDTSLMTLRDLWLLLWQGRSEPKWFESLVKK